MEFVERGGVFKQGPSITAGDKARCMYLVYSNTTQRGPYTLKPVPSGQGRLIQTHGTLCQKGFTYKKVQNPHPLPNHTYIIKRLGR